VSKLSILEVLLVHVFPSSILACSLVTHYNSLPAPLLIALKGREGQEAATAFLQIQPKQSFISSFVIAGLFMPRTTIQNHQKLHNSSTHKLIRKQCDMKKSCIN
jgi:hypothetical protein